MRNKKIFSFDEEKDAEEIITNGFEKGIDYSKMYIVAKYFRNVSGFGAIRLERELIKFCKSQDGNFNPVIEAEQIKKWVNTAMKFSLRKIDNIVITQKEIDFLKEITEAKDRKVLFMTLVMAKALNSKTTKNSKSKDIRSENYYIHYNNFLDIIRLTKIKNFTEIDYCKTLYKYKEFLTVYSPEKELIRIDYADKTLEGKVIEDLSNILDFYNSLFDKYICKQCGKEIIKTNNRQEFCKECYKENRNNKQKELMRKRRNTVSV